MIKRKEKQKKLDVLWQEGNKTFYAYNPTPFAPLYVHFEKMTLSRRIRLLLEYFSKGSYKVFYLSVDECLVGYCVVATGNRRLKCSAEQDIVLGPYYIDFKYRGRGYAKELIRLVLHESKLTYCYAFDYIKKTNIPSKQATVACGFEKYGELDIEGFFHNLIEKKSGQYEIYRYVP